MKENIASDGIATKRLTDQHKKFERALQDIEACVRIHAGAEEFFAIENFRGMLRWANDEGGTQARFAMDERNIVRQVEKEAGIQITFPHLRSTLLDLIADYRRAD